MAAVRPRGRNGDQRRSQRSDTRAHSAARRITAAGRSLCRSPLAPTQMSLFLSLSLSLLLSLQLTVTARRRAWSCRRRLLPLWRARLAWARCWIWVQLAAESLNKWELEPSLLQLQQEESMAQAEASTEALHRLHGGEIGAQMGAAAAADADGDADFAMVEAAAAAEVDAEAEAETEGRGRLVQVRGVLLSPGRCCTTRAAAPPGRDIRQCSDSGGGGGGGGDKCSKQCAATIGLAPHGPSDHQHRTTPLT